MVEVKIVNLAKDNHRKQTMIQTFSPSIDTEDFVEATDGRELSSQDYFKYLQVYYRRKGKLLTPSELGCTLSHIKCLEEFVLSGSKYLIVLEDDILGCFEDIEKAKEIVKTYSPDQNSVIILGGQNGLRTGWLQFGYVTENARYMIPSFLHNYFFRTCCYMVNRRTAIRLLKAHELNSYLADEWGELLKASQCNMEFINIFSHPIELVNSTIENERLSLNKVRGIKKVDLLMTKAFNIVKIAFFYLFNLRKV